MLAMVTLPQLPAAEAGWVMTASPIARQVVAKRFLIGFPLFPNRDVFLCPECPKSATVAGSKAVSVFGL
jgi:hypothetical protein